MIIFLLSIALAPAFFVRWVRWLAIVQQKEYRLDRLWAFLQSDEGKTELKRILPTKTDFTRTGMKRPHLTARVLMVAGLSGLALSLKSVAIIWTAGQQPRLSGFLVWLVSFGLLYIIVPISVVVGSFPSGIASGLATLRMLKKAQKKLYKTHPIIIGFGGSYGKTSTKHLVHHFLSQKFSVFVTPRSFNTKYSVAKSICDSYTGQEIALLEYGAYIKGEIAYMTRWFRPKLVVETGFTPQHLSLFGSIENSMQAESELVASLPSQGVVFCNGSDPGAVKICKIGAEQNQAIVEMYAGEDVKIELKQLKVNKFGQLQASWNEHQLHTQLIGKQYVVNLQAAMQVAQHLGMTKSEIRTAAESFRPNASFIQGKILKTGAYLIDDGGTSNPKGFEAALSLLKELPYTHKILLTAGMIDLGKETVAIHTSMANKAKVIGLQVVHLGIDGKQEFETVFGKELITNSVTALELLQRSNQKTVVLVEGKLPKVVEDEIRKLTARTI